MVNNQRKKFNREQVAKVIQYLEITDMNDIFDIKYDNTLSVISFIEHGIF